MEYYTEEEINDLWGEIQEKKDIVIGDFFYHEEIISILSTLPRDIATYVFENCLFVIHGPEKSGLYVGGYRGRVIWSETIADRHVILLDTEKIGQEQDRYNRLIRKIKRSKTHRDVDSEELAVFFLHIMIGCSIFEEVVLHEIAHVILQAGSPGGPKAQLYERTIEQEYDDDRQLLEWRKAYEEHFGPFQKQAEDATLEDRYDQALKFLEDCYTKHLETMKDTPDKPSYRALAKVTYEIYKAIARMVK